MALYCGIDLHSRVCWIAILDEGLKVIRLTKVDNDLGAMLPICARYTILGDSQLMDARIEEWRNGYRVKGTLKGDVKNGVKLDKNCLFILLVNIDEEKIDGNFHIKSNFFFDFSMEVGGFTLTRSLSGAHEGTGPATQSHGDGNSRENR